jgi:hypothetical protein
MLRTAYDSFLPTDTNQIRPRAQIISQPFAPKNGASRTSPALHVCIFSTSFHQNLRTKIIPFTLDVNTQVKILPPYVTDRHRMQIAPMPRQPHGNHELIFVAQDTTRAGIVLMKNSYRAWYSSKNTHTYR